MSNDRAYVDRERRRLTVGMTEVASEVGRRGSSHESFPEGGELTLEQLLKGKTWISVTSTSDDGKKVFANKNRAVRPEDKEETALSELVEASPIEAIAYRCCKGKKGKKDESPNQDSFSILIVPNEFAMYCVYDGHGPDGHKISEVVCEEVVVSLFYNKILESKPADQAFKEAFVETQEFLEATSKKDKKANTYDASMSGTTCTMVYHDFKANTLHVAHAGDSRAVLGICKVDGTVEAKALTVDHKPQDEKEKQRIEAAGGRVVFDGFYNHRVFAKHGHYPGLNMSRALGDLVGHKEAGLSPEPDIAVINLEEHKSKGDKICLLLCTDGVWEFIDDATAIWEMGIDKKDALDENLQRLTKKSYDAWMKDSENEISDDITGIAILL